MAVDMDARHLHTDPAGYERPSVTTDVAVFSLQTSREGHYRTDPTHAISLLLIRRGEEPYKDHWALPGGFLEKGETLEECAYRELKEETGVEPDTMLWVGPYSEPGRDPRGWIVSQAYVAIFTEAEATLVATEDAAEAVWFQVEMTCDAGGAATLVLRRGEQKLEARLRQEASRTGALRYRVEDSGGIAFDHASIIADAMALLKERAEDIRTVFAFLPETFTLSALQKVQETLMGISHLTPNFRRKIAAFVEETDQYTEGAGHRPARLFRRKQASNK